MKNKTIFLILVSIFCASVFHSVLVSQTKKNFEQEAVSQVSASEMRKLLELLNTLDRNSGSPGEYRAIEYLEHQLKSYDVPYKTYTFDSYLSWPIEGRLEAGGRTIQGRTVSFSASGQVEGELVFVGKPGLVFESLETDIYKGKDVRGKIVVADGLITPQHARFAEEQGAIGLVHINDFDILHEMIATTIWGTPTARNQQRIPKIPIVSIKKSDGDGLKAMSGKVRGRISMKVDTQWRPIKLIVAEVRGAQEPEKFILMSGHIDGWHKGVTDNGTANASLLETARILQEYRQQLDRSIRFAWWPGHSTGRYSGSAWYADNEWEDLYYNAIADMNIDGNGVRGSDPNRIFASGWPVLRRFSEKTIASITGKPISEGGFLPEGRIFRPFRAGDSSFQGIGIPNISGGVAGLPEGHADRRPYVGGSGGGWWWHTPEDTLDKVDIDILVRDTQIKMAELIRLANAPVIPYEFSPLVSDFHRAVSDIQAAAGGHFDLKQCLEKLDRLESAVTEIDRKTAHLQAHDLSPDRRRQIDKSILLLSRILQSTLYTELGPYEQDVAGPLPVLPALDPAKKLASMDPKSNEYGFLKAGLIRGRNWVSHALDIALERAGALQKLL